MEQDRSLGQKIEYYRKRARLSQLAFEVSINELNILEQKPSSFQSFYLDTFHNIPSQIHFL